MVASLRGVGRRLQSCSATPHTLPDLHMIGILDVKSQRATVGIMSVTLPWKPALGERASLPRQHCRLSLCCRHLKE